MVGLCFEFSTIMALDQIASPINQGVEGEVLGSLQCDIFIYKKLLGSSLFYLKWRESISL